MSEAWIIASAGRGERRWHQAYLLILSLLLIPGIGAEFMPHLDEGALWVRATMPYTISFDEAAKITPQIRDVLAFISRSHHGRLPSWAGQMTARIPRDFSMWNFMSGSNPIRNGGALTAPRRR